MPILAHSRLLELLDYEPETGLFRHRKPHPKAMAGDVAGSLKHTGYWGLRIDETDYLAHRVAWFYVYGMWPLRLDHEDRDKLNNRIANLREATVAQNAANKRHTKNISGFKGVRKRANNRWRAAIEKDGRHISLGTYGSPEEASAAYLAAAKKLFGEFARD